MSGLDVSFDGDDSDEDYGHPASYLPDLQYNPERLISRANEEETRNSRLHEAITVLEI